MAETPETNKPDFRNGFPIRDLLDGSMTLGQVDGEELVLGRRGDEFFAIGAHCTHYGGPLGEGLIVGDTVRCPWHHACFSFRNGEALRAPALDPVPVWRVERLGDKIFVREKLPPAAPKPGTAAPISVVIVGGGAAGLAAADMLRREGYDGPLTIVSADTSQPVDRPNLSKDYLAGTAQEEWIPLRPSDYYRDRGIDLLLQSRVSSLDTKGRRVLLENGKALEFGALLLATGADPVHLRIEGATDSQLHYLRTFADSKAIITKASSAKRVVVVGASFIGLEVAASLRTRGISVDVVAPDSQPLERIMGADVGHFIRKLHEAHGVTFHLEKTIRGVNGRTVTLTDGTTLDGDFLVLGVGVRPSLALAEQAGLAIDRGISVNEYLETNVPDVFAAGDVAEFFDVSIGLHNQMGTWNNSVSHGRIAGANMLGERKFYNDVPMYSTGLFDSRIRVMGLTPANVPDLESWESLDAANRNYQRLFFKDGRLVGGCLIGDIKMQTRIIQLIQSRQVTPESDRSKLLAAA